MPGPSGHANPSSSSAGYGNSPLSDSVSTEQGRVAFLLRVLKELGIQRPVLISPSMSGHYSVPFVLVHGAQLKGFVPIAPVGTQEYTAQQYQQVQVWQGRGSIWLWGRGFSAGRWGVGVIRA